MIKKVIILGSTGSIGTQALEVIRAHKEKFKVMALTCGSNIELLCKQIEEFAPEMVAVSNERDAKTIAESYPKVSVAYGEAGFIAAAEYEGDILLSAMMGMRGLVPTYHAIKAGKDIALANKETLVAGGELMMDAVKQAGIKLLPVDSEHSAIFQCLQGNEGKEIKRILLTASGGPFRGYSLEQLKKVTLAQALNHPNWSMGKKITIDSATMMNKGLEVIEARWLFDAPLERIEILVHPQSIVHSAVEFEDNAVLAQMGLPDMRVPIGIALGYPEKLPQDQKGLDFFKEGANLTFEPADPKVFRCIDLAFAASKAGGSYPVVMNAANEVLVEQFLQGKIQFIHIQEQIERILEAHNPIYHLGLNEIIEIDKSIREEVMG
ncbi:1-deoxy-D-xylulose-5-phosphate reductoisomerase [Clostridiales Family XIII bacterium PM5-7]